MFEDCQTMYVALKYLINIIESQNTGLKLIARLKNGLKTLDLNNPGYADIKINAVFAVPIPNDGSNNNNNGNNYYCQIVEV